MHAATRVMYMEDVKEKVMKIERGQKRLDVSYSIWLDNLKDVVLLVVLGIKIQLMQSSKSNV